MKSPTRVLVVDDNANTFHDEIRGLNHGIVPLETVRAVVAGRVVLVNP